MKNRRVYYECPSYIIYENLSVTTPLLIGTCHGESKIPENAFVDLKRVCSKLFGDKYCLHPSCIDFDHYCIKVMRLSN